MEKWQLLLKMLCLIAGSKVFVRLCTKNILTICIISSILYVKYPILVTEDWGIRVEDGELR